MTNKPAICERSAADELARIRKARGHTVMQVCQLTGLRPATVKTWELGTELPRERNLRLAEAYYGPDIRGWEWKQSQFTMRTNHWKARVDLIRRMVKRELRAIHPDVSSVVAVPVQRYRNFVDSVWQAAR